MSAETSRERATARGSACGSPASVAATSRRERRPRGSCRGRPRHRAAADLLVVVADQQLRCAARPAAASSAERRSGSRPGRPAAGRRSRCRRRRWCRRAGCRRAPGRGRRRRRGRAGRGGERLEQPGLGAQVARPTPARGGAAGRASARRARRGRGGWPATGRRSGAPGQPDQRASRRRAAPTRPATVSSRSSQVCHSTAAVGLDADQPVAGLADVGVRADLERRGVGVRADQPQPRLGRRRAAHPEGDEAAVPSRTKCWAPGASAQASGSASSVKPAAVSRRASSATAWNGEGEASTKARRSSPRVRSDMAAMVPVDVPAGWPRGSSLLPRG